MVAYSMPCWWVSWWLWRAGCISQDTYLLYDIETTDKFMDTAILNAFYRERIVEKEYSGLGIWETFIFIIPSRNFLFREYSISRSTNKYILSNSFADLSNISFEIQDIEFPNTSD